MCLKCYYSDTGMPFECVWCGHLIEDDHPWEKYQAMPYHINCYTVQIREDHRTCKGGIVPCYGCHIPLEELEGDVMVHDDHHPYCFECSKRIQVEEEYDG